MNHNTFIIITVLCFITHVIRTAYELLKHKRIIIPNKVTFVIIFINMIVLWISWFGMCSMDLYKILLPATVNYFGGLLFVAGVFVFFTALFTIKSLETYDGDLITHGIYSKIRHPMYLGFVLWLIGIPIYYGAVYSFFLSSFFIANVLFWRYLEEQELKKRFPGYKDYGKKTFF
jgi:protein-S-isoprenylcysteine O-methyltransferase Ste14